MPYSVTENQFREAFKEFGKILEFELKKDDRTGKSKGQGHILFERPEEAKDAIRVMDQAKFNDRVVLVKEDVIEFDNRDHRDFEKRDRRSPTRNDYNRPPAHHYRNERRYDEYFNQGQGGRQHDNRRNREGMRGGDYFR